MTKTSSRVPNRSRSETTRRWRGEGGSILIPVAVALLGLLAFSAFTIDNGVMLSSRRQAQNAADSAALAAALYLAWDNPNDEAGAQATAVAAAQQHAVWGNQPDVTLADVTFPPCPPGAPGLADVCVRVNVFRNQRANGDPLPAFFAMLAGVTEQGVQATATAQVLYQTGLNDCLLPFAIPDKWVELREDWTVDPTPVDPVWGDAEDDDFIPAPVFPYNEYPYDSQDPVGLGEIVLDWDPSDTFDVVEATGQSGGPVLTGVVDRYLPGPWSPATTVASGPTGYSPAMDYGMQVQIKAGTGNQIAPSSYYPFVMPDGLGSGASTYRTRIEGCTGPYTEEVGLNAVFDVEPGNMVGPTQQGVDYLVNLDQNAFWDATLDPGPACFDPACSPGMMINRAGMINGGCQDTPGSCLGGKPNVSPRHRAIAVFDTRNFMEGHRTGRGELIISGVIGLFLEGVLPSGDVIGRLTDYAPEPGGATTDNRSAFLRSVILVR